MAHRRIDTGGRCAPPLPHCLRQAVVLVRGRSPSILGSGAMHARRSVRMLDPTDRPLVKPTAPRSSVSTTDLLRQVRRGLSRVVGRAAYSVGWARALRIRPLRVLPRLRLGPGPIQCHSTRGTTAAEPCVMPSPGMLRFAPPLRSVGYRSSSQLVHSLGPLALPRLKPLRCARVYLGAAWGRLCRRRLWRVVRYPSGWGVVLRTTSSSALTVSPGGLV